MSQRRKKTNYAYINLFISNKTQQKRDFMCVSLLKRLQTSSLASIFPNIG